MEYPMSWCQVPLFHLFTSFFSGYQLLIILSLSCYYQSSSSFVLNPFFVVEVMGENSLQITKSIYILQTPP
ncbi:hypothetical protein YC2023_109029 [Brassica napus]